MMKLLHVCSPTAIILLTILGLSIKCSTVDQNVINPSPIMANSLRSETVDLTLSPMEKWLLNNELQKRHNIIHPAILKMRSMSSLGKEKMKSERVSTDDGNSFFDPFRQPSYPSELRRLSPFQDLDAVVKEPIMSGRFNNDGTVSKKWTLYNQKKSDALKKIRDIKKYLFSLMV